MSDDAERLVYINGRLVPHREAVVSVFDVGRLYGVTVYESIRTFRHRFFKLEAHLQRLAASLAYLGLNDQVDMDRIREALDQVLAANRRLTHADDDLWVCVEVTPGETFPMPLVAPQSAQPTIIAYSSALPHASYARHYTAGKPVVTAPFRNIPPQCFDQRCKNRSRFPHYLAKRHAQQINPDAFALLLDVDGFVTEGTGANIFFVSGGTLQTPTTRNILNGVSRQAVIELARRQGSDVVERDLSLYDAYDAEEAFWTTTSYCILPISSIDNRRIGSEYPGPVARALLAAWSETVEVDIVAQAQRFGGGEDEKVA
ncbi:MAG: branched-chain amino acid aminotransferase [Rhodopirellula sp.]|nr:branched-chain amino acid aminotransferase [Rhodopirellula sp.]